VQATFAKMFGIEGEISRDGSEFDLLLQDKQQFSAGSIPIEYFSTPGHTPACGSYRIGDAVFVGDCIFMPDSGTGRCDFPGGSAETMYHSIFNVLYRLPDETNLYVGHDYQPNGRMLQYVASVAVQKSQNIHIRAETSREDFLSFRKNRDQSLSAPRLLLPSLQVNIRAGFVPRPEASGGIFLRIPVTGNVLSS
jgi:glyoxylase-like metal-dependent hydrolase (beta-lactamase superfamily II)